MAQTITINSRSRTDFKDITSDVSNVLPSSFDGVCHVFCLHTTAGLTINENADPDVVRDIQICLERLVPWTDSAYRHMEGNSAAHVKSSLMGPALTIPVEDGRLVLGTWQSIYFCEFDGPRSRRVDVRCIAEN